MTDYDASRLGDLEPRYQVACRTLHSNKGPESVSNTCPVYTQESEVEWNIFTSQHVGDGVFIPISRLVWKGNQ